ncbi:hypothetical protein H6F74_08875 [Trichocoleus sp. FACHB-90]|uniref:hypothetical protein n=1 Tax=Cyanophyceae TaxID=3028117 RepID=UPI0016883D3B|nr:hypothetical protein [Trichocoleus sp. FACHB-90]MBD1926360.1 hypothetical protein [Trichocoleus sp. FACHB-90]
MNSSHWCKGWKLLICFLFLNACTASNANAAILAIACLASSILSCYKEATASGRLTD